MKKNMMLMSIVLTLGLLLAACGGNANTANNESAVNTTTTSDADITLAEGTFEPGAFSGDLPAVSLLIVGTFKLEDTEYAVDAEQAADLIPLWQVYKTLMESDITATEEINALTDQIAETMTAEQMQAIEDMGLTQTDVRTVSESLGLTTNMRGDGTGTGTADGELPSGDFSGEMPSGEIPSDEMPSGGGPGGGQGAGQGGGMGGGMGAGQGIDGTGLTTEEMQSLQATREASGGGGGFNGGMGANVSTDLIDALIQLLQSK